MGINYIAHSGGGEALDAILSGAVTVGVSGASEFADQVAAGQMRLLAPSAPERVTGIDAPTIKEAGFDVELANWRGIVAPPELTADQRTAAVDFIGRMHESAAWGATLTDKKWTDLLNLTLVRVRVKILEIPRPLLYGGILVFATLGVYSAANSVLDVLIMYAIGVLGFFMRRLDYPVAPVVLGAILGPLLDALLRRAMSIAQGNLGVFPSWPLSSALLLVAAGVLIVPYTRD